MPKRDVPGAGSVDPADHPPRALPDADWAYFLERGEALGLGLDDDLRAPMEALYGHLVGVNAWLNLTRIDSPRTWLVRHLLDSLIGLHDRRLQHLGDGAICLDLGSGGGYPGLPLALCLPHTKWVLVDSRQRKVSFLAAAATLVGEHVEARCFRGREVAAQAPDLHRACRLVVSRATGRAAALLEETKAMLMPHGHLVLYKGPAYATDEADEALAAAERHGFRHVTTHSVTLEPDDPERVLVVFERC